MLHKPVLVALTLSAILLVAPAAGAADSAASIQEPTAAAAAEAPTAPDDTLQPADANLCEPPVVVEAPLQLAAECRTTRCFLDSHCDSFCGGTGFGVCTNRCCFCAG